MEKRSRLKTSRNHKGETRGGGNPIIPSLSLTLPKPLPKPTPTPTPPFSSYPLEVGHLKSSYGSGNRYTLPQHGLWSL